MVEPVSTLPQGDYVDSFIITGNKIDIIVFLHYNPSGLAHFRFSIFPVFGHRISCHETGSIVAPAAHEDAQKRFSKIA
jgi:hypothetical protein